MEPTTFTIYMDAPIGRTYSFHGVRYTARRACVVSAEDADYLTKVLKGDGQPLFRSGEPTNPATGDDGKPLPPVDAVALQEERASNKEFRPDEAKTPTPDEEDEPQVEAGEESPKRRPRRKKQE